MILHLRRVVFDLLKKRTKHQFSLFLKVVFNLMFGYVIMSKSVKCTVVIDLFV